MISFARASDPAAAILILVQTDTDRVLGCLASIAASAPAPGSFEIAILANGADAVVAQTLRRFTRGVDVYHSPVNLGFCGGCNYLASRTRAPNVVFLNDDTTVEPGWLDALLAAASERPDAAAIGGRILFTDGSLAEAGSVIFSDGSTAGVGRGLPAGSTRFNFRRRIDYCSANSLLVRRDDFQMVGGFDEAYYPAYYEDADLALKLARRDRHVLYEPKARIRHVESASTAPDFRAFLFRRNRQIFADRWRDELARRVASGGVGSIAAAIHLARGYPRRVLIVDDRLPSPGLGSGYGRMFDVVQELSSAGVAVSYFPTATTSGDHSRLDSLGIECLRDTSLAKHLADPTRFYDAVVISRPHNFAIAAPELARHAPHTALIYDVEALFHRRLKLQRAFVSADALPEIDADIASFAAQERSIAASVDRLTCISNEELSALREIPECAPLDFMPPLVGGARFDARPFERREGLAFVASWLAGPNAPNVDALRFFVDDILPLVLERYPLTQLYVTGGDAPDYVRALASRNVRILGYVDDLRDLYGRVVATVSPLRFGAGVKIKTIESLQYGTPVVATRVGAEGLDFTGHPDAIDVENEAAAFADKILKLLGQRGHWEKRRQAIRAVVAAWEKARGPRWVETIDRAIASRLKRSTG